jgi:(p)ppGpp synthase/HD superfamily hydrolase
MKEALGFTSHEALPYDSLEKYIESEPKLTRAYEVAEKVHEGQSRDEGIPYITHCLAVARILYEEWGITNVDILATAFLHDTVEDKHFPIEQIRFEFGENVASWVEAVTKLPETGNLSKEEADSKTLRKVNDASFIEPQVGVIKLADRLHNMRTLIYVKDPEKQVRKAKETLFYAKLAESLGMWEVVRELEDLSLMHIDPKEYKKYLSIRDSDPRTQNEFVEGLKSKLRTILAAQKIEAHVEAGKNSLLRIKGKMGNYSPEKVDDMMRFRIVVKGDGEADTRNRVMIALGALWQEYDQIEDKERFDNFFFTPRDNGYSALHLTLKFPQGSVKIALTCEEKELYNNEGILSLINKGQTDLQKYALKLVITPTKEFKFFRAGATGIDYAYSISPIMGAKAEFMLIDGVRHELTEVIPNGVEVEIKRTESRKVPKSGLEEFALPSARRIIDEQIDEQRKSEKTMEGKAIVEKIIRKRGLLDFEDLKEMDKYKDAYENILYILGCKEKVMDLYYKIGTEVLDKATFIKALKDRHISKKEMGITTIYVEGHNDHGISKMIIGNITELGADIGHQRSSVSERDATFWLKLIVKEFSKESESKLMEVLHNDPRIKKVDIV